MHKVADNNMIEITSQPESLSIVENMIHEARNKYNVSEDLFGNMLVAITEAVTNAIYHGNKSDPSKKVGIRCTSDNNNLCWTVTDQGDGFDYYNLPDPTAPENLEKECGRGI